MKRTSSSDDSHRTKRFKGVSDAFFDDAKHSLLASHVYKNGTVDEHGYISGKILMVWPPIQKRLLFVLGTVCVHEGQEQRHRFDVCLSGSCAKFFGDIDLKPHDEVYLALKGVRVEKMSRYVPTGTLPMKLHYEEGIIMKHIRHAGPASFAKILDTWQQTESAIIDGDDWFSTPRDVSVNVTTIKEPSRNQVDPEIIGANHPVPIPNSEDFDRSKVPACFVRKAEDELSNLPERLPESDRSHTPGATITTPVVPLQNPYSASSTFSSVDMRQNPPELSKKQQKKKKKAEREQLQKQSKQTEIKRTEGSAPLTKDAISSKNSINPQKTIRNAPTASPSANDIAALPVQSNKTFNVPQQQEDLQSVAPASSSGNHDPLDLQAGLRTVNPAYDPLDKLLPRSTTNIIGVVTYTSDITVTKTGEFKLSIRLIDPSNVIIENFGASQEGFGINCFAKKYRQWLPSPMPGDVLILRGIKVVEWNGQNNGVGYSSNFRWAIYSPAKGEVQHGELNDAPERDGLADGFGYVFSPFHYPGEEEMRFCVKMSDWWREVLKKRQQALREVHQIGGGPLQALKLYGKSPRRHLLIEEADPDVEPGGYFDCTVEVLGGFAYDNGVYGLFVTDYTHNNYVASAQGKWCHPSLGDLALKIDMWDSAAEIGPSMLPGSYYSLQNVRMVAKPSGFIEGKITEKKIQHLKETEADKNTNLRSLLERKKAWAEINDPDSHFAHLLIKDVVENKFFNCTVEIVHVDEMDAISDSTAIFVTDYTCHPSLSCIRFNESWSKDLEGSIVKVILKEGQVHMVKNAVGAYYTIKNLRLKNSVTRKTFQGFLGGNDKLIQRLNPRNTDNAELVELLRRKSSWQQKIDAEKQKALKPPLLDSAHAYVPRTLPLNKRRPHTTIKDIEANHKCPNKFRVIARLVAFRPSALHDCVIAVCNRCNKDIPNSQKACHECDDFDHEYVQYLYQLFILLEDEHGDQLKVSVNDNCPLLAGLRRVDIRDDVSAFNEFRKCITPLLRNLTEVPKAQDNLIDLILETPFLSFTIDCWKTSKDEKAYCLATYEEISDFL